MTVWLAIAQLLLIASGIASILWLLSRHTDHLQALLVMNRANVAAERAQQIAAVLAAQDVNRQLLLQLVAARAPTPGAIVLVVDDSADDRELTRIRLVRAGYRVRLVDSAEAALASLARDGFPDLILLDLALVHMPGLALIGELRAVGYAGAVIAHSGSQIGEAAALAAGCSGFIEKTTDDWQFLQAVARGLDAAR
jgi:CheY-like chemotaxis protein